MLVASRTGPVYLTGQPKRKPRPHRPYRSSRRHFRGRKRAAVLRAMTAARLYLDQTAPTLAAAAVECGSNERYVRAAVILIKTENAVLVDRALFGQVNLLKAAHDAQRLADLVK